jgi:hypothetical protein
VKGLGKYASLPSSSSPGRSTSSIGDVDESMNNNPNRERFASSRRHPVDIIMLQGALRPHPALQEIINRIKWAQMGILNESETFITTGTSLSAARTDTVPGNSRRSGPTERRFRYMTIHARVEPDMQHHPVCVDKKVLLLNEIIDMVESTFQDVSDQLDMVFLPINRQYLEQEVDDVITNSHGGRSSNDIAIRNLQRLNALRDYGMWNGTVPVKEFGSNALRGTVYEHRPSLAGSILNYFLGVDADIFVGTEVSSFSHDLLAARFFRRRWSQHPDYYQRLQDAAKESDIGRQMTSLYGAVDFKYLPSGIFPWIKSDMTDPPGHMC